jgi:phage terminase Nu1 subunit (DNA packaging protein)
MNQTTPAPAEGRRARPRARRAKLRESETGLVPRAAFAVMHGVSERTVMKWAREGLPYIRVGGLVFFRLESARAWFAGRETARDR